MTHRSIKLLVGTLLLVAPASLGIAYTDEVTLPMLDSPHASTGDTEGEVVDSYEKTFDTELTTGELDLRIDRGKVHLVAWDKNAYRIEVVQSSTDGDGETSVDFQDASEGDHLNLSLTVDYESSSSVYVNAGPVEQGQTAPDRAIVARVPADVAYERVLACEGQAHGSSVIEDTVQQIPGVNSEEREHDVCVPAEDGESPGSLYVGSHNSTEQLNLTSAVQGLNGTELDVTTDDADLDLEELAFEDAAITSDDGAITGADVSVGTLELATDDGDVRIQRADLETAKLATDDADLGVEGELGEVNATTDDGDVTFRGHIAGADLDSDDGLLRVDGALDEGSIATDDGDVVLALQPERDGTIDVQTDDGTVAVGLPVSEAYGYDVKATSDDGDIEIGLNETENASDSSSDEQNSEHVRTEDYENRDVQLGLTAETDDGDIRVTEDEPEIEAIPADGDEESSTDASGPASGLASASSLR